MKKLNRLTSALLAVIMIFSVLTIAPFTVSAATYGDFEYTLEDDFTCTITKYNGNASNVTIPSSIYGNKVKKISGFDRTNIINLVIPNGVEEINTGSYSWGCFEECKNLKTVTLPNTLKTLGWKSFSKCSSLESIVIPSSVKTIDSYAFENCSNLSNIAISNGIVNIGQRAFAGCSKVVNISIPNSVKSIEKQAFSGCSQLKSISIGSGVESISGNVFEEFNYWERCKNLESISVDSNNKYYSSSNGVLFDKNKTVIVIYPYNKLSSEYIIPNTVKNIYTDTFVNCLKLKTITIPSSVINIEDSAVGYTKDSWEYEKISGFTIKGYKGTQAEIYARNNDFNFVEVPKLVNPTSVKVNRSTLTLGVGESYGIVKTISPSNATQTCTWSSSNSSVASVDSNGKVTAKKAGTANITVKTSNGLTATCKVTVKPAPTSVKISNTSLTLGKGETFTVSQSTNSDSYAWGFSWSSSNTNVATVTKGSGNKATITAKGTGTATITIKTYNGKTATCKVTVKPAPTSVTTNPTSVTLGKGETYTISEVTNSGSYANASNLKWSTTNSSVATVTKGSGNKATITAKGVGTAYVKITLYNGKTATCKVTVKPAPTSVKTNPTSVTLGKGETYTISEVTNSGSYANASNLKWSTTNSSVATVTKGSGNKAKITAKGVGTAYVKITLYNGKTATCKVTVKPAPTSVKLSKTSITLKKGQTYTISESTNSGSYANASNLKWSSTNSSVATVTKGSANKATITAKAKGTTYIKITLYNGKTAQCKVTVK